MIESLRTIATAAPGTFHVVRVAFTYASKPGNGSFCCARIGSADETNPIAAIARALVRLMMVLQNEYRVGRISVCQYGIPITPAPASVPAWLTLEPPQKLEQDHGSLRADALLLRSDPSDRRSRSV